MNSEKLLEKCVEKLGTASAVADVLGVGRAFVSRVRSGEKALTEMQCAQLAKLVDESPEIAWLEAAKERARSDEEKNLLGKLLRSFKAASFLLTICAALLLAGFPDISYAGVGVMTDQSILYNVYKQEDADAPQEV